MVYQIIFKKRFQNKLEKLLVYIEQEFGLLVAKKFAGELENKLNTIQRYTFILSLNIVKGLTPKVESLIL